MIARVKRGRLFLSLSDSLPVVPGKLVRRILQAESVNMADLLMDNVEAERRMQADNGGAQSHFHS